MSLVDNRTVGNNLGLGTRIQEKVVMMNLTSSSMLQGILMSLSENQQSKFRKLFLATQLPSFKESTKIRRNKSNCLKNNWMTLRAASKNMNKSSIDINWT